MGYRTGMTSALGAGAVAGGAAEGARAIDDAVDEAVGGLRRPASFVLVFPPAGLDPDATAEHVTAATGEVPWAGMSSDGVIAAGSMVPDGCTALAFDDTVVVGAGVGEGASHDPRGAARRAATDAFAALDATAGHALALLLFDPDAGLHSEMVAGAYEVGGPRVPIAGGGANAPVGAVSAPGPAQFAAGRAYHDSVVAVVLVAPSPIAIGIGHGCELAGLPAIVTRSEGRRIMGLNGRPAEETYLDAIGVGHRQLDDRAFERLAAVHPLAQLELGGRVRPRHVRGRAPGGGLRCATSIPENAAVAFSAQSPDGIRTSARGAMRSALERLQAPPRAALVFDCAARRRILGGDPQAELATLTTELGDGPPLVGLYTRGEVARTRGATGDLNHAVVVVTFA